MNWLAGSLGSPAADLAADEVLLDACEHGGPEVLRCFESPRRFVVLGYANRAESEINLEACRAAGVPVLRRITGGGCVLQGPGCLSYSLVLRVRDGEATSSITQTNLWIMNRHAAALAELTGLPVRRRGDTDLAVGDRKFSGNAQRRGRRALLFHGTFLLQFDLAAISCLLPPPTREPDYRAGRSHADFVTNLDLDPGRVQALLRRIWSANDPAPPPSPAAIAERVQARYERDDWNLRF